MTDREQIYRIPDVLGPAIDALVASRPRAMKHVETGRYGNLLASWKGQVALVRARLVSEVVASSLRRAEGQPLAELVASEYFAELPPDPQRAVGEAVIFRQVVNASSGTIGNFTAGSIPVGKRFRRAAAPDAFPPREEALYQTTEPQVVDKNDTQPPQNLGGGQYRHTQAFALNVAAMREGPHANTPYDGSSASVECELVDTLFSADFEATEVVAAGGTLGIADEQLRALALATYSGLNGPNVQALIAGALTDPGVRRAVHFLDPNTARAVLYVGDESWASSFNYRQRVLKRLNAKPWTGFGARCELRGIQNVGITLKATVMLRGSEYSGDVADIAAAVRKVTRRYFDERPDWYTWRLSALGGIISSADPKRRVLTCTSVQVTGSTGTALTEPSVNFIQDTGTLPNLLNHYNLLGDGVHLTFETPS